jgi:hypothetical protein
MGLAITGYALAIIPAVPLPSWVLIVAASVSLLFTLVQLILNSFLHTTALDHRLAKELLRFPPPKVREADPFSDMLVFRSLIAQRFADATGIPPYIPREVDVALDRALQDINRTTLVLVIGAAKTGKTRSLYEAAVRNCPEHSLLIPRDGAGLNQVLTIDDQLQFSPEPSVLWLDDLERFVVASRIDQKTLADWQTERTNPVLVLATLRRTELKRLMDASGDVGTNFRQLLERHATEVELSDVPSDMDLSRAGNLYRGEDFRDGFA